MSKSKTYIITNHGKERVKTRGGYERKQEVLALFKNALHNGKSPAEFKPPFSDFLKSKLSRGAQVKVYANMIFIYKNKTLITCYLVPGKFLQQISDEKRKKYIRRSFSGVTSKQLRNEFVNNLNMLRAYSVLSTKYRIYEDEDLKHELFELWERTDFILEEMYIRLGEEECESDIDITKENILTLFIEASEAFAETTKGMLGFGGHVNSKTKGQHKKDKKSFYHYIADLKKILKYIENEDFFLVQNQVIKQEESGRLENVKKRRWILW